MKVTRLGELRARAMLTQGALAARSGVHRNTISKLESGEHASAHAKTVMKLAKALGVAPSELVEPIDKSTDNLLQAEERAVPSPLITWFRRREHTTCLPSRKTRVVEAAGYVRDALSNLDESADLEVYYGLEFAALILLGWPDWRAREEAHRRVYTLQEEESYEKEHRDDG